MSVEVFEDEFYQEDFTTSSEWETFISRLSELFENFEVPEDGEPLSRNELSYCQWTTERDEIYFNDFELIVTRYKANIQQVESSKRKQFQAFQDLISTENDYYLLDSASNKSNIHPIAVWYGLRDFIVIQSKRKALSDLSQIKLLQSSMNLAVYDSKCKIPSFIQIARQEQNVYLGILECVQQRILFDIVHLKTAPPSCKYLSGILDLFKGKVNMNYINPTMVSACLSYSLKNFLTAAYSSEKDSNAGDWDVIDFVNVLSNLPFGVSVDPIHELILHTRWPQVSENVVIDSQTYSDFNPHNSPFWSIGIRFDCSPVCFLADMLNEFLTLTESPEALTEYYNFLSSKHRDKEMGNPFSALTDSKISNLPGTLENVNHTIAGPLNEQQVRNIFEYLMPDEDSENKFPYTEIKDEQKIKSAVPDSLVHRLSVVISSIYTSFSGRKGVAQIWAEFLQKLRDRVQKCMEIPGVARGFPDMRTCLLNQKLQMLNLCMERKNIREGKLPFSMLLIKKQEGKLDSDEEFFDCDDDRIIDDKEKALTSPWNPVGRIKQLGKMLLKDSEELLYIPVTQDPVPKTEDELEDDAEMLLNVSDSNLRAQLMSASLLSDMESFKAANPMGQLEDFIRWYSPRDWIEEEHDESGRKGHLSDRMMIPGNTWQTVWKSAKPVPAVRQKRLFDDTKSIAKVLEFLSSQTLGSIGQLIVVPLFHSALLKLQKESLDIKCFVPNYQDLEDKLKQTCSTLSREKWNLSKNNSRKKWEMVANDIAELELMINQAKSMVKKLYGDKTDLSDDDKKLLNSLMKCHETELTEGAKNDVGIRVMHMFNAAKAAESEQRADEHQWSLPDPIEKQFTLRLSGNTVNKGLGGPQFLRAILSPNEFRLCGAFSHNTTFA